MTFRHLTILIECTLFLLVCSCNKQKGARSIEEIKAELASIHPDSTIFAHLVEIKPDSLVMKNRFNGDIINYAYTRATSEGQVYGSLTEGDLFAMLVEPSHKMAFHIINITQMSGQWFYNPEEQRGFNLSEDGDLSSINADRFSFKRWKIHNGKIILYYIGMQDIAHNSRDYKTDTTEIQYLTPDELTFTFQGEVLHCTHKKEAIKVQFDF